MPFEKGVVEGRLCRGFESVWPSLTKCQSVKSKMTYRTMAKGAIIWTFSASDQDPAERVVVGPVGGSRGGSRMREDNWILWGCV